MSPQNLSGQIAEVLIIAAFMITQKRATGNKGEEKAAEYLISKGYSIVERNFNTKFGEIDIVARNRGGNIVFVEVKSAKKGGYIVPEENITFYKMRRFIKAIDIFLHICRISLEQQWQMDSISVLFDGQGGDAEIRHIENINIR